MTRPTRDDLLQATPPEWQSWLLAALVLTLAAAIAEGVVRSRRGGYDWRAFAATLGDVAGRRVVDALGLSLAAPLVWIGFDPLVVAAAVALNLGYQFWLHAPWIPRLGALEWVLNTPSHHRVHHACNPAYVDRNFGGVLIVFDRLFGPFAAERDDVPPRYGLTTPLHSYNPLRIALHGWVVLACDLAAARGWRARLRVVFGPPPSTSLPTRRTGHLPTRSSR